MVTYQRRPFSIRIKSSITGYFSPSKSSVLILVSVLATCCPIRCDFLKIAAATHIVHHYVPGQPFYVRTLVYHRVKAMMVDQGVRLNDFGVVARGNRFFEQMSEVAPNNSNIHSMVAWMVTAMVVGVVAFPFINLWMLVSYLIHVPIMHYEKLTAPKVSKTCENLAEKCEKSE